MPWYLLLGDFLADMGKISGKRIGCFSHSLLMCFNCEWSLKKTKQKNTAYDLALEGTHLPGTSYMDKSNLENIQMANTEYGHDGSKVGRREL